MSGCDNSSTETSSQLNTKEEAQKTAERFARYWEQKDASSMYGLFIPELQEKRNKEDFVKFFGASENLTNPVIRLDQVNLDKENEAYAYYTTYSAIYTSSYNFKAPAIKLEYLNGSWKINTFNSFFTEPCAEKCFNFSCTEAKCDSTTSFKCQYFSIEPCSCNEDLDCPYGKPLCLNNVCSPEMCESYSDCSITQESKDECESKDLVFYVKSECSSEGRCSLKCSRHAEDPEFRNPTEERATMLDMSISESEGQIKIENRDVSLTKVTLRINYDYKKEFDRIESGAEMILNASDFLNDKGQELSRATQIERIYLYSQQGKWWKIAN